MAFLPTCRVVRYVTETRRRGVVTLLAEGEIEGLEIRSDCSLGRGFPLRHSADPVDMGGES